MGGAVQVQCWWMLRTLVTLVLVPIRRHLPAVLPWHRRPSSWHLLMPIPAQWDSRLPNRQRFEVHRGELDRNLGAQHVF